MEFKLGRGHLPLSSFKAVFFDVGGTLIHVHPSVGDVYAKYARPFGLSGSAQDLNDVYEVFQPLGGLDRFEEYFDLIFDAFREKSNWRIYEDVVESKILETLKKRGVVLGVISNWDSRLISTLENIGLAHYFDFILPSAMIGSAKPDKKIFEEALKRSGVAPHEACHIGDEIRTDVEGAQRVGIHSILLDRDNRFDSAGTNKVTSFLQLV